MASTHLKLTTWPADSNTSISCSSVAVYGTFPTNTVLLPCCCCPPAGGPAEDILSVPLRGDSLESRNRKERLSSKSEILCSPGTGRLASPRMSAPAPAKKFLNK